MADSKGQENKEYHFTVLEGHTTGMRLDKYIASFIQNVSRTKVQKAIKGEYVTVNGQLEKKSYQMEPGDQIDIHLPIPKPPETKAERSEEHTSELQSRFDLVCSLLLEKKNIQIF